MAGRECAAGCRCATARAAPAPPPPARPSPGSGGHGGGASTAGPSARRRPGTPGGSARPSTKPPSRSSPGPWTTGSAPSSVGDPRGVLHLKAGRRHNQRTRDWRVGHLIGPCPTRPRPPGSPCTWSTSAAPPPPAPAAPGGYPKPAGRNFTCPHCGQHGHRDLVAAASIAARAPGGGIIPEVPHGPGITHRRAGAHLPGVHPARRDPRRRPPSRPAPRRHLAGTGPPPPRQTTAAHGESLAPTRGARNHTGTTPTNLQAGALRPQHGRRRRVGWQAEPCPRSGCRAGYSRAAVAAIVA